MDDSFVKDFTTSIPTTFHFSPKFGENDENDHICSPKVDKSNKQALKHFMLPTMSAASKAVVGPRKKILGERNEVFTVTKSQYQKSPILDSRISPIVSGRSIRSSCSSAYDTDNDDEVENIDGDSVLKKPYDPLTNYLSPRPRFLRYNPNRMRKIFLNGENEMTEITDGVGVGVVSTSSSSESQKDVVEENTSEEGYVNEEMEKSEGIRTDADEEDVEEEEEEETKEFEEGKCWSLKGFLKFLLVLGSLFVFTTFIISINSPSPTQIQEGSLEFGYGFLNQSNIHEVVARKEYFTSEFEVMSGKGDESLFSLMDVPQNDMGDKFVELRISEDGNDRGLLECTTGLSEGLDVQNEQNEVDSNDEVKVRNEQLEVDSSDEVEVQNEHLEDDSIDQVEVSDLQSTSSLEFGANKSVIDQEIVNIQGDSDQVHVTEAAENIESFQENLISENEATIDLNAKNQQMEQEDIKFQPNVSENEATIDLNAKNQQMEQEDIKFQPNVVVLAISVTIVAALGLIYHYSRQTNSGKKDDFPIQEGNHEQDNLPTEMQLDVELVEATNIETSNVICSVEEEKLKKFESFGSPSPVHSQKVASEQFSRQSNAPIVELLGELVIGEEASSSFRSLVIGEEASSSFRSLVIGEEASSSFRSPEMRRKILDPEQKNNNYVPTMQIRMSPGSKATSIQKDSSQLEFSTAEFPSHGPFTTEKKKNVAKKEESKGGEESIASLTPVRRSSRIRHRAMSR